MSTPTQDAYQGQLPLTGDSTQAGDIGAIAVIGMAIVVLGLALGRRLRGV